MQEIMKTVLGEGPKRPKLILIGEAPGEDEERLGRPFVGSSGKELDKVLIDCRVKREDCYIDNVVTIRPPGNKIARLGELGYTIDDFVPALIERLKGVECPVCVPLGDIPTSVLTGKKGITKHRGSVYDYGIVDNLVYVPTFHPRYIMENYKMRGAVCEDIKKALRIASGGREKVEFNTLIKPTIEEVEWFINRLLREVGKWSFDIETIGEVIACLGLGADFATRRESICIPFKFGYKNYWSGGEEYYIWTMLRRLFRSDSVKIGQNMDYDITFLNLFIGEPTPPWFDTKIAHHLCDPELPHSLAFMVSIYFDGQYYKDDPKEEGKGWRYATSSEALWDYNGKDVEYTLALESKLARELKELGLWEFFTGYQMPLTQTMWKLQQRGMCVDEDKKSSFITEIVPIIERKQVEIDEKVGYKLNVNSPQQMIKFLYTDLNLPIQYHRKSRRPTANAETLEKLFARYANETFKLVMELRELYKVTGTYLAAKPSEDGRYRGIYGITETGRSNCKKYYGRVGFDMQNIPRTPKNGGEGELPIRSMFIPSPGKVFKCYDMWQAEVYCVAVFSQVTSFLTKLLKGEKIHSMVASWIFNKPESEIDEDEYYTGKRTVHAANYDMGPHTFAVLIKQPFSKAKEILATFHKYAPEIKVGHAEIRQELFRGRKLVTPFGRVRFFRGRMGYESDATFKEAYAHLPQSTIADCVHQGMVKLDYLLPPDAKMVQEGFDSFIVECYPEQEQEVDRCVGVALDKELFWKGQMFKIPYEVKGEWK